MKTTGINTRNANGVFVSGGRICEPSRPTCSLLNLQIFMSFCHHTVP